MSRSLPYSVSHAKIGTWHTARAKRLAQNVRDSSASVSLRARRDKLARFLNVAVELPRDLGLEVRAQTDQVL